MTQKNGPRDLSFISDRLFDGIVYRFISEPEDLRRSAGDIDAFIDLANDKNLKEKIEKIKSAEIIIQRENDKEYVFNAFTSFLEGSPYALILIDRKFNHIFSNRKSKNILNDLFERNTPRKLKPKLRSLFEKKVEITQYSNSQLITIPRAVNDINAYLITIVNSAFNDDECKILLVPDSSEHKFELHDDLISQYQLTKKEQALISNLIKGLNLKEVCEKNNVSLNTIRSHLKSIFLKTKTKSQTDLICTFLTHEVNFIDSYVRSTETANEEPILNTDNDLFVILNSKKRICYREYGPPDGRPLVIFHNTMGSRFHIPWNHEKTLDKYNRRIIVPERPGYGRSDPVKNYIPQWNEMFVEFLDNRNLSKVDILGNVFACPLVIQFANAHPDFISSAILTSPVLLNNRNQASLLGKIPSALSRLVSFSPALTSRVYGLWAEKMKYNTVRYLTDMIHEYSGSAEQESILSEKFIQQLALNFTESQRNKSIGCVQDSIFSLSPRKFSLGKIAMPFNIWIGDEDLCISVESAKVIYNPLPNKTFHICKGHSEDVFYHRFEDIIK